MRFRAAYAAGAVLALSYVVVPSAYAEGDVQECVIGTTHYIDEAPAAIDQLGFEAAWPISRGNVIVAVVDSGVDATNEHLAGAVLPGTDFVDGGDGRTDDTGHGTAVAGVIAAREVDGSGLIGVAPAAQILPVRVYADDSARASEEGLGPDPVRTAAGIRWAADNGATIIAVPQSTVTDVAELRDAVDYATSLGALVVASSGNSLDDVDDDVARFPAAYSPALAATAVDTAGYPSGSVARGEHVEIAAPGQAVLSTFFGNGDCVFAGNAPSTSYATGYVAGAAALVAAAYPDEQPADWEYRLLVTALRPAQAWRDGSIGWGIVAPASALTFINDGSVAGPPNPRFPAATQAPMPIAERPIAPPDPVPERKTAVFALVGGVGALTLAALLAARLRKKKS